MRAGPRGPALLRDRSTIPAAQGPPISEVIVHAEFHLVDHHGVAPVGEVCRANRGAGHREVVDLRSEVDEIVFDLGRPVRQEGVFKAHAERPAPAVHARVAREGGRERRLSNIGNGLAVARPGTAALQVNEGAFDRCADASGEGRNPLDLRAAIHEERRRVA